MLDECQFCGNRNHFFIKTVYSVISRLWQFKCVRGKGYWTGYDLAALLFTLLVRLGIGPRMSHRRLKLIATIGMSRGMEGMAITGTRFLSVGFRDDFWCPAWTKVHAPLGWLGYRSYDGISVQLPNAVFFYISAHQLAYKSCDIWNKVPVAYYSLENDVDHCLVWMTSQISSYVSVWKNYEQETSLRARMTILDITELRTLLNIEYLTCSPSSNVDSTPLSMCSCNVFSQFIMRLWTMDSTSAFLTTPSSANIRSI